MMGATTLSSPTANKSFNGAKKTITDFFGKSPSKSPLGEVKHKDLLDYFSKPSCGKNAKNNALLVEEFSPSANFPKKVAAVNNIENSINAKNKKRKYSGKELTISNNNHDNNNGVKPKKRKSNGFLYEKTSSSLIISKVNQSNNKSAKTADVQENAGAKKVEGKSVQRTRAKPKCPDGKAKSYKPLAFGASNLKTSDIDLASPLSDDTNDVDINSSKALELSYEEFLQSQETESENLENETELNEDKEDEKIKGKGGKDAGDEESEDAGDEESEDAGDEESEDAGDESEDSENEESEEAEDEESEASEDQKSEKSEDEADKKPEDDVSTSPCPKSTKSFSIATFFSPIPKPPPKKENSDFQKVTVLADIHPEPRQKPSSPKQAPTRPKSGDVVLKTISLNAKSKIKEPDGIVLLSTEHHSDAKVVPEPSDGIKQKSYKKTISSAERAPKKSAKKESSSNVSEEKSSQSLLNFSGHKLSSSKVQDDVSIIEDTNSSQLTLTVSNQKTKAQSDVQVKEHDSAAVVKETLKKKRGRPRKISIKESEDTTQVVNKEEKPVNSRKRQIDSKELQTTNAKDIVNVETSTPKKKERNSGKISKAEQENVDGYSTPKNDDNLEKKTQGSDPALKLNKKTPKTPENAPIPLGTRRSARLRDHKAVSPPSSPQEVQTPTTISKTRKEKKKPNSCSSEKSKESSTGKESQTKQADSGKLASIFLKKKDKEKEKAAAAPVIDEEALKLRRAFLMGGLTDEAKKQKQANALLSSAIVTADYPPLPSENHIQQKPLPKEEEQNGSNLDVWNLPDVRLPGLTISDDNFEVCSLEIPEWKSPSSLLRISADKRNQSRAIKPFSGHIPLSENDVSSAIKDLSAANPSYPVQRFYDMAKAKGKNSLKTEGEDTAKTIGNQKSSEPQVVEKPKRRRLGRRKAAQVALNQDVCKESTEKEKIDCSLEDKVCDILWTEKYQPQHSTEVISNCGNLKKLKSWLLEWKQQTDKEIRKLRKMLIKQRKHKKSKGEDSSSSSSWLDDDDVFEGSSSESDDDSLCNTMLLSGPHGVGKTSAIYALAAELGYQVFEVNASSARTGKKILTQLQEATQSHQVSKENAERSTPINVGLMNNLNNQNKETSQKKLASSASFANFFKSSKNVKPDPVSNSKENKKDTSKNKKKQTSLNLLKGAKSGKILTLKSKPDVTETDSNCDFESASDKIKQRVNISSTSLILFDEVDVVLEEDKGFWAAIQNFMMSTKRPIILTASSADIAEQFGSSCEHLSFRIPSTKVITSHLQTLCLAENVLTDSSGISSLVDYFDADMRVCLLNLQFWINSGGDLNKYAAPIGSKSKSKKKASKTADSPSPKNENRLTHENCLESCLGLNPQNVKRFFNDDLIKAASETISWEDLTPICFHGYQRHFSLLHQLFASKLPLPQKFFPPLPNKVQHIQTARKKAMNNNNPSRMFDSISDTGLYESESSSLDDFLTLPKPKEKEAKMDMSSQPVSCSQESEASYSTSQPVDPQMEGLPSEENVNPISELSPEDLCRQRNCENKILNNLAKFYECCSYTDMFSTSCGYTVPVSSLSLSSTFGRSTVTSGLWDELPMEESYSQGVHWCAESTVDLVAHLELRTYVTCQRDIFQASKNVVSGHERSISVAPQRQCYGLASLQLHDQSRVVNQQRAVENVLSNIPLSSGFQQNSLHLDYLPMLRDVCRTEKTRQQAKLKRRFFHYFDNISFPLRESTLNVLATGFT